MLTILGIVLFIFAGLLAGLHIDVDFNLSTFTSEDSPEFINYQTYRDKFPSGKSGLIVAVQAEQGFQTIENASKLDDLTNEIDELSGVKSATSITSIKLPRKNGFGTAQYRLLPTENEPLFSKRFEKLNRFADVTPKFLSKDKKSACIYVDLTDDNHQKTLLEIETCLDSYHFVETYVIGGVASKEHAKTQLSFELKYLPIIAGAILLLLFYLLFRDFKSLLAVLVMIGFNLSGVLLAFWLFDIRVGVLTLSVPLLILVLSFCDIVHFLFVFKKKGLERQIEERLAETTGALKRALWLTSITTFGAFAIFTVSGVKEIIDFGVLTAVGIAIAFLSARYLLPKCIQILRVPPFRKLPAFTRTTEKLVRTMRCYRGVSIAGVFALIVLSTVAIFTFSFDNNTSRNLGSLNDGMNFLNEHFEGTRTIEVIIADTNVFTEESIHLVDKIEQYLTESYGCSSVFSLNTVVKRLNRFNNFGIANQFRIPERLDDGFFEELERQRESLGLNNAVTQDHKVLKIVGKLKDFGSADARDRNEALQAFIAPFRHTDRQVFLSGFSFVHDLSMLRVTKLILLSVLLSVAVTLLIIGVAFRSIKYALVLFVPNALPMVSAVVLMYFLGIDVNPFSAMALSILLGLSIDDTIYLASTAKSMFYKEEGIENALRENVFPVMTTSLLLSVGFAVMMLSTVTANKNIGLLVSLILLIALLSDLIVLPALLKWMRKSSE